jgi:two-component system, OmpR family, sensor kinase
VRQSIRARLILAVLALLVPVSVAGGWLLVEVFGDRLLRDIDVALQEEAETVAALLSNPTGADVMATLLAHVATETDLGAGKRIVVSRDGVVVGEAPSGARMSLASSDPRLRRVVVQAGPPENPLTVAIGVPASSALHAKQQLMLLLGVSIPAALLVIAAGLWVVIGRALRPLADAVRRMETVGVDDLSARLPVESPDDEVGRMVLALNRMLDRLAAAVGEMRRFTADAAHELRTPLTVLRTGLEVALHRERSAAEYRAALTDALESTERLAQLAEDLLALTRLAGDEGSRATVPLDLAETLHEVAEAWVPQAAQRNVAFQVSAEPGLIVQGVAGELYRLLNNLVDNALRHSPPGGRIQLLAATNEGWVRITVADEGPGIPTDGTERLFERFYRGRGECGPGSGLGLSIAQAIAHAHGGQVVLANREAGGTAATVALPLARTAGG